MLRNTIKIMSKNMSCRFIRFWLPKLKYLHVVRRTSSRWNLVCKLRGPNGPFYSPCVNITGVPFVHRSDWKRKEVPREDNPGYSRNTIYTPYGTTLQFTGKKRYPKRQPGMSSQRFSLSWCAVLLLCAVKCTYSISLSSFKAVEVENYPRTCSGRWPLTHNSDY